MKNIKNKLIIFLELFTLLFSYEYIYKGKLTIYALNPFFGSLLVGLILSFFLNDKLKDLSKSKKVLVYIFTIFMIVGEVVDATGDILNIIRFKYIIVTFLKIFGYYFLFINNIKVVDFLLLNKHKWKPKNKLINKYISSLEKHPFGTSFISFFIICSIFMIVFYPIVLSPDPAFQIKMYYNVPTKYIYWVVQRDPNVFMTNHHPILQTFMLGWCLDLGRMILNDNFGLFIYTFIQSIMISICVSFTVSFLKKHKVDPNYSFILMLIYMIVPMFGFYTVSAVKDTYYTIFFIYLVLFLYDFVHDKGNNLTWVNVLKLFVISIFLCLFRQNGIYIILIILPVMAFYSLKNVIKISVVFFLVIGTMWSYNNVLIPGLGVSDGSIREALSVPFQQTARLVKYHKEIISEEDLKVIDTILHVDTLGERYESTLSDKVKNEFNKDATKEDLKAYFKVWFKYLLKEPICYINATLNNTTGYFYPYKLRWYFYHNYDSRVTVGEKSVNYHYNKLGKIRDILSTYAIIYPYIPVIGLLSNIGFGTFSVMYLIANLIEKKKKQYIIVLIPLIISILVCLVGPANTYFRYAMPYLFVLPTLEILFKKENEV